MRVHKFLLTLLAVTLVGCLDSEERVIEEKSQGLVYCAEANPVSFNPQVTTTGSTIDIIANQLYDRLISIDPVTAEFQSELATDWKVSKDGKSVTFTLRQNVPFHATAYFTPTRTFNADDVIFTFSRLFDVYNPYHFVGDASYPYFQSVGVDQLIRKIVRVSDYQVRFELFNAESSFLANMATDFAVVLSAEYAMKRKAAEQEGLFDQYPVGTGPYIYREYRRDNLVRFYRNPDYWKHDVALEQLVYDITPNGTARIAKLLTKECDLAAHPSSAQLSILAQREDINIEKETNLNVGYWAFNTERPPFDDIRVRKALAHAIDTDKIMQAVYYGNGTRAESMLPPTSWAFNAQTSMPSFDPDLAKKLLAEAGFSDGFDMNIWAMPVSRIYNPNARKMAELMQSDLRKVGVNVSIVEYEWNTFIQRIGEHRHDSVLLGWAADTPDPDNFFSPLLSCSATFSGKNPANWCNPKFDLLLAQALDTTDLNMRKKYYADVQSLIMDELPLLPIAHGLRFQASSADVDGIELGPFGAISLANARKK